MPDVRAHGESSEVCRLEGIGKSYGSNRVLTDVGLTLRAGEVHAVLGENGAGKSTLMKILAGAESADTGLIVLDGQPESFRTVREANERGIATVFQETMLFGTLDAIENLSNAAFPTRAGLIDRSAMEARVRPVLEELNVSVDLRQSVEGMSLPVRQMLEIAKALLVDARILILDEPNSALRQDDSERLFTVVDALRKRGVAVVYVSHRLEEVFRFADSISVLRDGRMVYSGAAAELTIPDTIDLMLGRKQSALVKSFEHASELGAEVVNLQGLGSALLHDLDLSVRAGEVVGLAGLEGCGAADLMRLFFGQERKHTGRATILGAEGVPRSASHAVHRGIALVPSDRGGEGLALDASIVDNAASVHTAVFNTSLILTRRSLMETARRGLRGIAARIPSLDHPVSSLSGGNQQKVVFAKWRLTNPRLLLLEDPARGVDVGAKVEIFDAVRTMTTAGCGALFQSSDFGDYALVCDRVLVMRSGTIVAEIDGRSADEHALLRAIHPHPASDATSDSHILVSAEVNSVDELSGPNEGISHVR